MKYLHIIFLINIIGKNTILKIGDKLSAKIDKVNEITGEVNLFIKN